MLVDDRINIMEEPLSSEGFRSSVFAKWFLEAWDAKAKNPNLLWIFLFFCFALPPKAAWPNNLASQASKKPLGQ
jgi:hypothetical protein